MATNPESPLLQWIGRNHNRIAWLLVAYLFGVNQSLQKSAKENVSWETKYMEDKQKQINAANALAFKYMLNSDSVFVIGFDSIRVLPRPPDTNKKAR